MQTPGRQAAWQLRHGPFERRQLPPLKKPAWTLLVQGVDLHHEGVHQLLQQFRFVSDARLDDLMISYASDGGGVGPHFDSYDVFLLQAHGRRRWRIGRQKDLTLQDGLPLKILAHFEAEQEYVLEPGDMLYLPPRYAHDGVAEGECMTYSVGFRSPSRAELAREMLHMLSQEAEEAVGGRLYGDAGQPPAAQAGEIPGHLRAFALDALQAVLADPKALDRALGQYLTEPKANVWFDPAEADTHRFDAGGLRLDRRTRMMYDDHQVYINGESFLAKGRDFELMRQLANQRGLSADAYKRLSAGARQLMQDWMDAGWLWRQ
jgi:50S ribosomal protein L16 3-hydroxylase